MPTLQELKSQIADLEKQAAEMHAHESEAAIATVRDLVVRYGLTAEQVGLASPSRSAAAVGKKTPRASPTSKTVRTGAGIAKYADPATGKTWTGFGKPPGWIAAAKDREAFRIGASGNTPPSAKSSATSKRSTGRSRAS